MIGIIAAEDMEIQAILKTMIVNSKKIIQHYTFYEGTISQHDVVLIQGGIGKVNAAIGATLLINHYPIKGLINCGVAGGIHLSQNVGDVVIAKDVLHYDVDVTAFGRELGQIPNLPLLFKCDNHYCTIMQDALKQLDFHSIMGTIGSGDQFVAREEQVSFIHSHFPQVQCVEMEGAAIAQVCHLFHIPFIIIRSLSDIFNKDENKIQYDEYLEKASQISALTCKAFLSKL